MRSTLKTLSGLCLSLLAMACVTERVIVREPRPRPYLPPPPPPPAPAVVSVVIEPPIGQPEPLGCPWAPPPMLVEVPPPPPFEGAIWTGGYWVWHGTWVWAHGRWAAPPMPRYRWHPPYYENREGVVIFITGHWGPPERAFVPPPPGLRVTLEIGAAGVVPGPRPMGPSGVFVPPPPGSRVGLIIPAPVGTPPAVVTGAPPVVRVGMRITDNRSTVVHHVTNITNVTNITHVTLVAPPSATASGKGVNASMPLQAHLAAAMPSVVQAPAPSPRTARPIPPFTHGQVPALPPQGGRGASSNPAQGPAPQAPGALRTPPPGVPRSRVQDNPPAPRPLEGPRERSFKGPAAAPDPVQPLGLGPRPDRARPRAQEGGRVEPAPQGQPARKARDRKGAKDPKVQAPEGRRKKSERAQEPSPERDR